MTTDGMKRRDFLRTVTTLVGAVALGGSASLLSGCGGNGGSPPSGPTLNTPSAPATKTVAQAAGALTNSGFAVSSSTSTAGKDASGNALPTLTSSSSSAAATALSTAAANLPAGTSLGVFADGQEQSITLQAFQNGIAAYLQGLAALGDEAPLITAGDSIVIITYTLPNGQKIASPAIVDGNGNIIFDAASALAVPSTSDSAHYVTQGVTKGAQSVASTTLFNPVNGSLQYSNTLSGTANSEANGNLNPSNPVTGVSVGTPTLGPGVTQGSVSIGQPVAKAVPVNTVAKGRATVCVTITATVSITIAAFGISVTITITITLTICSTTSGSSGNGG